MPPGEGARRTGCRSSTSSPSGWAAKPAPEKALLVWVVRERIGLSMIAVLGGNLVQGG
jgi:hypothetical protein